MGDHHRADLVSALVGSSMAFAAKRPPPRPPLRGESLTHAKEGRGGGVRDPRMFCASKMPSFLARWRVRGRPAVRGPAGTGSVGDGVGEGARTHAQTHTHRLLQERYGCAMCDRGATPGLGWSYVSRTRTQTRTPAATQTCSTRHTEAKAERGGRGRCYRTERCDWMGRRVWQV